MNGPKLNCGSANGRTLPSIATVTRRTAADNNCTWWWFNRVLEEDDEGPLVVEWKLRPLGSERNYIIIMSGTPEQDNWGGPMVVTRCACCMAPQKYYIFATPHHRPSSAGWRLCVFVASSATTIIMGPQSLHPLIWAANNNISKQCNHTWGWMAGQTARYY